MNERQEQLIMAIIAVISFLCIVLLMMEYA
jgi:hypothetical protein